MSDRRCCHVDRAERKGAHGFGYTVKELARAWRAEFDRRFRPLGLSDTSWVVIWVLSEHGPLVQRQLAETLGVEGPTLVRLLDRMEKDGWVRRQASPTDRRANLVVLTDQSRPVYDAMLDLGIALREELLQGIPPHELETAHSVMLRLLDKFDALAAGGAAPAGETGGQPPKG